MTVVAERGVRYFKTNPECPSNRHRPERRSYVDGCVCARTLAANAEWEKLAGAPGRQGRVSASAEECLGPRHAATNDSWRLGCRCPGALAAHRDWLEQVRAERKAAVASFKRTGVCVARNHDTIAAYRDRGCRCDLAVKLHRAKWDREREQEVARREQEMTVNPWRPVVRRLDLFLLLTGCAAEPSRGELLAGMIALSRRRVPNGPVCSRPMTNEEISTLLGCAEREIFRLRRERDRNRENRHLRRLADVKLKAKRVARAMSR